MRAVRLFALVLVVVGAALLAAGLDGVQRLAELVVATSGWILLIVAAAWLLALVASREALAGPAVLGLTGLAVVATQRAWWARPDAVAWSGILLVALGGLLVVRQPATLPSAVDPVHRVLVIGPRTIALPAGQRSPDRLRVLVICGRARVDLTRARAPRDSVMELLVSCWAGRMTLQVPGSWPVVAGRVSAALATQFVGELDSREAFTDLGDSEQYAKLLALAAQRQARYAHQDEHRSVAVVVHVLGFGGIVEVAARA